MRDVTGTMQYVFAAMGGALGAVMGGFDGFLYGLVVFVAVDYVTGVMVGILSVLRTAVVFFYLSNEGISILENAVKIGLPIPEKLKSVLEQLKEGNGHEGK